MDSAIQEQPGRQETQAGARKLVNNYGTEESKKKMAKTTDNGK